MDRETKVELGIVYTRAPTGYWVRLYTLDDGRNITCNELALRVMIMLIQKVGSNQEIGTLILL